MQMKFCITFKLNKCHKCVQLVYKQGSEATSLRWGRKEGGSPAFSVAHH